MILNGKEINQKRAQVLQEQIAASSVIPHLVIIQIGDRAESNVYVQQKTVFGEKIGAHVTVHKLPESITTEDVVAVVRECNHKEDIHGIILQLPIPEHLNVETILNAIDPTKDVDGLSATNIRRIATNNHEGIVPATAKGILTLLQEYDISVEGKHVVIVGRSLLVGKSTALLMSNNNATVTLCHSKTKDLPEVTRQADILIVATGVPDLITKDFVHKDQIIIDVGITAAGGKRVVGDVAFEEVGDLVAGISPVPGGVGPMTVLSLFENLLKTALK